MKKQPPTKGRRPEMNVPLGTDTITRWAKLYATNDYAEINRMVDNPPTTAVTISKHINAAAKDSNWKMPLSIAKALKAFYENKEKQQQAVA